MNKKVGIVCCSNGQPISCKEDIDNLSKLLKTKNIEAVFSDYIYANESCRSGTACERANALMNFYRDNTIAAIYDISGGDMANEILPYLDYSIIKANPKAFYGYSDLTTVINAIYTMTGNESVLYQVKNLVWDKTGIQYNSFEKRTMYEINYEFYQGQHMEGVVVGGNIRCLLKLAGTEYFPDMTDKILLLEALNGDVPQVTAYLNQLKQMKVFDKIAGVLLGTFTYMEEKQVKPKAVELLKDCINNNSIPIVRTKQIGHSPLSRAVVIGKKYFF